MVIKNRDNQYLLEVFRKYEQDCEIDMVNCGYEKCSPHFSTSTHIRPYYLLHFVSNGEVVFPDNVV